MKQLSYKKILIFEKNITVKIPEIRLNRKSFQAEGYNFIQNFCLKHVHRFNLVKICLRLR